MFPLRDENPTLTTPVVTIAFILVNVIVWLQIAERQQRVLTGARLMAVRGVLQRDGDVVHVVARRLEDHSALIGDLAVRSRDFH